MRNPEQMGFIPEESLDQSTEITEARLDQNTEASKEDGFVSETLQKSKEKLREYALTIAATSALFNFAAFEQNKVYAQSSFTDKSVSKVESENKLYKETNLNKVQQGLLTDETERFLLSIPQKGNTLMEFGEAQTRSGYVNYQEILKVLRTLPNADAFTFLHTHPKVAYKLIFEMEGKTQNEMEEAFTGDQLPYHPPSFTDFIAQYDMAKAFRTVGMKVEAKVIDPQNTWTYSVSANNKLIEGILRLQKEVQQKRAQALNNSEEQLLDEILDSNKYDPRNLADELAALKPSNPKEQRMKALGEKLIASDNAVMSKHTHILETYEKINNLGIEIVMADSESKREELLETYISLCKTNGIFVNREAIISRK